jgi:carbamate kinase
LLVASALRAALAVVVVGVGGGGVVVIREKRMTIRHLI